MYAAPPANRAGRRRARGTVSYRYMYYKDVLGTVPGTVERTLRAAWVVAEACAYAVMRPGPWVVRLGRWVRAAGRARAGRGGRPAVTVTPTARQTEVS